MNRSVKRLSASLATLALVVTIHAMPAESGETSGSCEFCFEECPSPAEIDLLCSSQCPEGETEGQCDPSALQCFFFGDDGGEQGAFVSCLDDGEN